ncbi:MAG: aspartate carbamoyltransferase [Lentisphaerae bacterium]|nr:aspartate carbamoyltransferase [Lentisphaerota bacterium]
MRLSEIAWESFHNLDVYAKAPYLHEHGHPFHVLIAEQFDRAQLDELSALATQIRFIAKSDDGMDFLRSLLRNKRVMLYFSQPSTRTFLSFRAACQILGMRIGDVRDSSTSSEFKGESHEDSVRTFSSYFDCIIMRTKIGGLAEKMAWVLSNSERPVPIVNAGSGSDQHPTQALLDVYTLLRSFEARGGIDGKTIVFVGDLARGRTVRSLASLLINYKDVRQCFVAPDRFQIGKDILARLNAAGVKYELLSDFKSILPEADAVYMTRVQDEWDSEKGESAKIDISRYCIGANDLKLMRPNAIIMHPLPRRKEISTDIDHDSRAMYWRQMRNGMWVRVALIAAIFEVDNKIREYHGKTY